MENSVSVEILPPLAGEVAERSEAEGGICRDLQRNDRLSAPYPLLRRVLPPQVGAEWVGSWNDTQIEVGNPAHFGGKYLVKQREGAFLQIFA